MAKVAALFLVVYGVILGGNVSSYAAQPQWRPTQNIEIVVGRGTGGGVDTTARTILRIFQDRKLIGVSGTIVNRPGGGGAVGWAYLNQHSGNGHYLSISVLDFLTNNIIGTSSQKHTDFTPISQLFSEFLVFVVSADSPANNGRDLIGLYKKNPTGVSAGISPSVGAAAHIALALALKEAGVDARTLKVVVFNSGGQATTAVMGGHVTLVVTSLSTVASHIAAGRVKAVAVSAPQRLGGVFANIPTWGDQGINAVLHNWRGVIGPRGLSSAQVSYWEEVFRALTESEEWKKDLEQNTWADSYMDSRGSRKFLDEQHVHLTQILADLGLAKR